MIDFTFANDLAERIGLDDDARTFFAGLAKKLPSEPVNEIVSLLSDDPSNAKRHSELCDALAEREGVNPHSITAFIQLAASEKLHDKFAAKGISDDIFYDTMDDFRCKLLECREMHGVNGIFTRDWTFSFHCAHRFALGRLQYELFTWQGEPLILGDRVVLPGDPVLNSHIPSSGKPFDREARFDSYRRAAEFFGDRFDGDVAIICNSWLLDPVMISRLHKGSNIRDFASDFEVVIGRTSEQFHDAWRVFGHHVSLPPAELPEDSELRRICKARLLAGEKFMYGRGIRFVKQKK